MSVTDGSQERVTREIPLELLEAPAFDVRDSRDQDELRNLAHSLEENGQIQAASCYLGDLDMGNEEISPEELSMGDLIDRADSITVVDGWSRKLAAEILGWPTLRCEVYREPPEEAVLTSLAANTDRLEMSDYETVKVLRDLKEARGLTLEELSEHVPYAPSTLSRYISLLESYPPAVEEWRDPESHVSLGHVDAIDRSHNEEVAEKAMRDLLEYERSVSYTRGVVRRANNDFHKSQADSRSMEERQRDGEREAADREIQKGYEAAEEERVCDICGGRASSRVALEVCPEDRGLIKRAQNLGEPLMQAAVEEADPQDPKAEPSDD